MTSKEPIQPLIDYGGHLVPSALYARFAKLNNPADITNQKQGSGVLAIPDFQRSLLERAEPFMAATKSGATINGKANLDETQQNISLAISPDGLSLMFDINAAFAEMSLERDLSQMQELFFQGAAKWQDLIRRASDGELSAIQQVIGSIWAVQFGDKYPDSFERNWKQQFFKDDPFGEWFFSKVTANALGQMHDVTNYDAFEYGIYHNLYMNKFKNRFDEQAKKKYIQITGEEAKEFNNEAVLEIVEFQSRSEKKEGALMYDFRAHNAGQLLQNIETEKVTSTPAQILGIRETLASDAAKEDKNIGGIIAAVASKRGYGNWKYDRSKNVIQITLEPGESVMGTFKTVNDLLDYAGKTTHADLALELTGQVELSEREDALSSFNELKQFNAGQGIKIPPAVKAEIKLQLQNNLAYLWLYSGRGGGKTTTMASMARLLETQIKDQGIAADLPVVQPVHNTPEGIIKAMRQAMWRLIQGKPTLLVCDEIHRALNNQITEDQAKDLLNLERIFNDMASRGLIKAGGIVFGGELPTREITVVGTGKTIGLGAGGEAHRFPEQELTLWNGDSKHDEEVLREIIGKYVESDVHQEVFSEVLKRINTSAEEDRRFLTPSFLFDIVKKAGARLQASEQMDIVLSDLNISINKRIVGGTEERLSAIGGRLGTQLTEVQEKVGEVKDLAEAGQTDAREALSRLDALETKYGTEMAAVLKQLETLSTQIAELQKAKTVSEASQPKPITEQTTNIPAKPSTKKTNVDTEFQ